MEMDTTVKATAHYCRSTAPPRRRAANATHFQVAVQCNKAVRAAKQAAVV